MVVPGVEGNFGRANGSGDGQACAGRMGRDDGQSGAQRAVIEARVEDRCTQSFGGDAVAIGFGNALYQAVQTQSTQIISNPSRGELAGFFSQQWSNVLAKILVGERALDEKEQEQDVQESLNARIGET